MESIFVFSKIEGFDLPYHSLVKNLTSLIMTFVIFKYVVSDNGNLSVAGNCIDDFVSVWVISNGIKSDKAFTVIEIETIFINECNFVEFNHFSNSFLFDIAVRQWARSIVTMTDKELRKEKDDLLDYLFEKISKVKSNTDLKEILKKVDELNVYLDKNDSPLENLLDTITQNLSTSIQTKIKRKLHDIFDKYDKKSKADELIYTDSDRQKIQELIRQINEICDKNFWDRFKTVLGIGT